MHIDKSNPLALQPHQPRPRAITTVFQSDFQESRSERQPLSSHRQPDGRGRKWFRRCNLRHLQRKPTSLQCACQISRVLVNVGHSRGLCIESYSELDAFIE